MFFLYFLFLNEELALPILFLFDKVILLIFFKVSIFLVSDSSELANSSTFEEFKSFFKLTPFEEFSIGEFDEFSLILFGININTGTTNG